MKFGTFSPMALDADLPQPVRDSYEAQASALVANGAEQAEVERKREGLRLLGVRNLTQSAVDEIRALSFKLTDLLAQEAKLRIKLDGWFTGEYRQGMLAVATAREGELADARRQVRAKLLEIGFTGGSVSNSAVDVHPAVLQAYSRLRQVRQMNQILCDSLPTFPAFAENHARILEIRKALKAAKASAGDHVRGACFV